MERIIRSATDADLPALEVAFPRPNGRHRQRLRAQSQQRAVYLVVLEADKLVGSVLVRWPAMRDTWTHAVAHMPRISDLHVVAERRGQGIGTALLERAEQLAREQAEKGISLSVALDNPARRLYERRGYRDVGLPVYPLRWVKVHADRSEEQIVEDVIILVKDL